MPLLRWVPAIPLWQRVSQLQAGRQPMLHTPPRAPLLTPLLCKELPTRPPKFTETKATGFAQFLISRALLIFWITGFLLKVSRKVAALYHDLCSLLSQQIILHLQKHWLLHAPLLCLEGRGKEPSWASQGGFEGQKSLRKSRFPVTSKCYTAHPSPKVSRSGLPSNTWLYLYGLSVQLQSVITLPDGVWSPVVAQHSDAVQSFQHPAAIIPIPWKPLSLVTIYIYTQICIKKYVI